MMYMLPLGAVLFAFGALVGIFAWAGLEKARDSRDRRLCPACRGSVWLESLQGPQRDGYWPYGAKDLVALAGRMGLCKKHANDYVALQYVVDKTEDGI